MKIAILYWGSKGGAVRQIQNYMHAANNLGLQITWCLSSNFERISEIHDFTDNKILLTQIPAHKLSIILNLKLRNRVVKETLRALDSANIQRVYFLLPHPWDVVLSKKIHKKTEIEVVRAIHDNKPHKGEVWPSKWTIRSMARNADYLVTYSNFVAGSLKKMKKPLLVTSIYEYPIPTKIKKENFVLHFGRMKKYQGIDNLEKAWPLLKTKNINLIVAGNLRRRKKHVTAGVDYIKKWMTNDEIEKLIASSRLVVLPYKEASQSGIIPLAHSLYTPVVITPVGGMTEQVIDGINGVISKSTKPEDIAHSIDVALTIKNWNKIAQHS
jgi:glycosyltransferase involved in cell wall biosynthesis